MIVLGGGVMAAGELLLEPARDEFRPRALPPQNGDPDPAAALGAEAGMIGAAILALDEAAGRRAGREPRLMAGRLIVCPTPIGNIADASPRLRQALADADLVACEDTRRAGRLYERLELESPRFVSNHDANEEDRAPQLAKAIERGARVALLSDAGTPVLSDPGYRLIADLHRARPRDRGAARAERDHHRPRRLGPARRPLALRGLPAAPRRRARARPAVD